MTRYTLRQRCSRAELQAHDILDRAMAGEVFHVATINRALATLGDA